MLNRAKLAYTIGSWIMIKRNKRRMAAKVARRGRWMDYRQWTRAIRMRLLPLPLPFLSIIQNNFSVYFATECTAFVACLIEIDMRIFKWVCGNFASMGVRQKQHGVHSSCVAFTHTTRYAHAERWMCRHICHFYIFTPQLDWSCITICEYASMPARSFMFAAQILAFAVPSAAIRTPRPWLHSPCALMLCHYYYYCYYSNEVLAVCRVKSHIVRFSDANGYGCSVSFAIAIGLKSNAASDSFTVFIRYSFFFLLCARRCHQLGSLGGSFLFTSILSVRSFFQFYFCWFFVYSSPFTASVDVALPFLFCFFCIDVVASRLHWTLSLTLPCALFS